MRNIVFLFTSLLFIAGCGLPDVSDLSQIQTPMGLRAELTDKVCSVGNFQLTLKFYAYNAEDSFDGFNVYIFDIEADQDPDNNVSTNITERIGARDKVISHLNYNSSSDTYSFNDTVEKEYIVKNTSGDQPTFPVTSKQGYAQEVSIKVTTKSNENPLSTGRKYAFIVTAVSTRSRKESAPSNYIDKFDDGSDIICNP